MPGKKQAIVGENWNKEMIWGMEIKFLNQELLAQII